MFKAITLAAISLSLAISAFAQSKTNDAISRQIRTLGAEKSITVSFDASGPTSKLMAVAENFSNSDADHAGVEAMNFALGFFYPGTTLQSSPSSYHFAFWIKTRKPRFADNHKFVADLGGGRQIDFGEARYSPRARDDMEYLNFEVTRADLSTLASADNVTFHLGSYNFTVTSAQLKLIRNLLRVSDPTLGN
jgi:hypothetical protein